MRIQNKLTHISQEVIQETTVDNDAMDAAKGNKEKEPDEV